MRVRLFKEFVEEIGTDVLTKIYPKADVDRIKWQPYVEINLVYLDKEKCDRLLKLCEKHRNTRGTPSLIRDIETWYKAKDPSKKVPRPRNLKQATALITERLRNNPGHRLFKQNAERGVWVCYYVEKTVYYPPKRHSDYTEPAYGAIYLAYEEFGEVHTEQIHIDKEDIVKRNDIEILMAKGFVYETPELRKEYLAEIERYHSIAGEVGKQFWATGTATDDLDGNKKSDRWYYRSVQTIKLDKDGDPSRVVIDVFQEEEEEKKTGYGRSRRRESFDSMFWATDLSIWDQEVDEEAPVNVEEGEEIVDEEELTEIEIPIHPMVATFDMRRHTRLKIHISQLAEYIYDPDLGGKLILPVEERELVSILIGGAGGFKDIVKGKGGGAVILCAGPPGTGKTLTAEVYAEVMEMPLYTVQCSQLGLTAEQLEGELLKVFARSARWGAILLLDEADVYVSKRGTDLQQNAIVGVFLRTLEYYRGVLFLTTNRKDLVDDAIASRCVARIDYGVPSIENQKKIWRVLADTAEIDIPDKVISEVADKMPDLTGRDVKNLLKLASMVSEAKEKPITVKMIEYVKRFKPTESYDRNGVAESELAVK